MELSVEEIQQQIIAEKDLHSELAVFSSTSMFAKWRKWTFVIATSFRTVISRFTTFVNDVLELLSKQKVGRVRWYAEMAKKYQHGHSVVTDTDTYDNTGLDEAVIEASRVVKFSACVDVGTRLRLKVAGLTSGSLAPITTAQLAGFISYMENDVKFAGVYIEYVNSVADELQLTYKIYYDPNILDATGKRLDGTNDTPIQNAITDYLLNGITFNGYFSSSKLTDNLQVIDGVVIPSLQVAKARFGLSPFSDIIDVYQADAGYLRLAPSDLTLIFIPSPL